MALGAGLGGAGCAWVMLAAIGVLAIAWWAPPRTATASLMISIALAAAARSGASHRALDAMRRQVSAGGTLARVVGVVCQPPARESGVTTVVVSVTAARPALALGSRLRLVLPEGLSAEWSDRLNALAQIDPPAPARNPGGFDARAGAIAAGTIAFGRAYVAVLAPARGPSAWPRATLGRWRRAMERRFDALSPESRALVAPLVFGDRGGLSPERFARLRSSGLVHLLALSGMHVTWMAGVVGTLVAAAGAGVRARAVASALCALLYLGLAGPVPSLCRAAMTELLSATARIRGRAIDPLQALAVSAVALLTACPRWAADVGLQLSFAATLGLMTVGARTPPAPRALGSVPATAIASLGAQVAAAPVLVSRFHALAWWAPITNLAAVPISGLLLAAAWLALVIDLALPGAAAPWWGACEALSRALDAVAAWGASLPGASRGARSDAGLPWIAAAGAAMLAFALVPAPGARVGAARRPPRLAMGVVGAALCAAAWFAATFAPALAPAAGTWWVVTLDVGQGDAIALASRDGWRLVDAGPRTRHGDAGEQMVLPFLRWAGVCRLEALVLTHDDADHTGGAVAVRRDVSVAQIVTPGAPVAAALARRFGARTRIAGNLLGLDPPVRVAWPPAGLPPETPDNAAGLVLEIGDGAGRVLLLADVDSLVEARLPTSAPVAALKIGHHGSGSSTSLALLQRVRPRIAIVSCGRRNAFGHPHPTTLARLRAAQVQILRTDEQGAIWLICSNEGVEQWNWRHGPPPSHDLPTPIPIPRPHP